jgi:hypothetical protein
MSPNTRAIWEKNKYRAFFFCKDICSAGYSQQVIDQARIYILKKKYVQTYM